MPPRPLVPRLTLYTGGKECSLCEVAKQELAKIQAIHRFDLDLWNIRDPPSGVDEREAKRWRRLYQYDIGFRAFKGRLTEMPAGPPPRGQEDPEAPHQRPGAHRSSRGMAAGTPPEQSQSTSSRSRDRVISESSRSSRYAPYRSVLRHLDSAGTSAQEAESSAAAADRSKRPPWRRKIGTAWLALDSKFGACCGETLPLAEEKQFNDILEATFERFAENQDEWSLPIIDVDPLETSTLKGSASNGALPLEVDFELDIQPQRGFVPGDTNVLFESLQTPSIPPSSSSIRPNQVCWNCREAGHMLADCPSPRDHLQIRASRELFMAQKEAMPEFALPFLQDYVFTEEERTRRLALLDRFLPGLISETLAEAVYWYDAEEDGGLDGAEEGEVSIQEEWKEMMRLKRKRREWPWFEWMLKWGYPPGWVAARDPRQEVRRRLKTATVHENDQMDDSDLEDDLSIFLGDNAESGSTAGADLPAVTRSRPSLTSRAGDETDMIIVPDTPPPPPDPPPSQPSPPPPAASPPHLRPSGLPPAGPHAHRLQREPGIPVRRWAKYDASTFSSELLMVYDETYPVPLAFR